MRLNYFKLLLILSIRGENMSFDYANSRKIDLYLNTSLFNWNLDPRRDLAPWGNGMIQLSQGEEWDDGNTTGNVVN